MNVADIGVLLRFVAFAIIITALVLLKNKRCRGKIIVQWRTTLKCELLNNIMNLNMFIIAIAMVVIFDDVLFDVVWFKIFMDIGLLACITALLLMPKDAIITDKGILFAGIFMPWNAFSRYRVNRISKTVMLWRKAVLFSEKVMVSVEDAEEVEKILSLYLHE